MIGQAGRTLSRHLLQGYNKALAVYGFEDTVKDVSSLERWNYVSFNRERREPKAMERSGAVNMEEPVRSLSTCSHLKRTHGLTHLRMSS